MSHSLDELRRARRRSPVLWGTGILVLTLVVWTWSSGLLELDELFLGRRRDNLVRFLTIEAVPEPVRTAPQGAKFEAWLDWLAPRLTGRNLHAAFSTLLLAIVATALAATLALILAPLAARRRGGEPRRLGALFRWLCVLLRATPEYLLAFLLGAVFPSPAWAAVLALGIHNAGVLGRLFGETVENLDPRAPRAFQWLGSRGASTYLVAELPTAAPRLLTYVFYRFETCVRESTALGMLGFVSIGHWIVQERAAQHVADMVLLVLFGASIVVAGDLVSWWARARIRSNRS